VTGFNATSQSFIIRFWAELRQEEDSIGELRGVIEHVQSGELNYFMHVEEISELIAPYLLSLGVEPTSVRSNKSLRHQIRKFLKRHIEI
jgi:hypothetical protein